MRAAARVALAAAVLIATFALVRWWDFALPAIGAARYQAVFLTNGQTYFGRYTDRLGSYVKVEDAFYIQQTPSADPAQPPDSKLVRRGTELHAPFQRMLIPKSALLFVEDLTPSSPVAQFMDQTLRR